MNDLSLGVRSSPGQARRLEPLRCWNIVVGLGQDRTGRRELPQSFLLAAPARWCYNGICKELAPV